MEYTLILLAAGRGSRTHLDYNKVFYKLEDDLTVLDKSLQLFSQDPDCVKILVIGADHELEYMKEQYGHYPKTEFLCGGEQRQDSVYNGLQNTDSEYVLIHDAARPYLKRELVEALKEKLETYPAALLMVPAVDTLKIVDENGIVQKTLERSQVYHAQTPQGFKTALIQEVHNKARQASVLGTDDASLVELFSMEPVAMVLSDPSNTKITNPSDLK